MRLIKIEVKKRSKSTNLIAYLAKMISYGRYTINWAQSNPPTDTPTQPQHKIDANAATINQNQNRHYVVNLQLVLDYRSVENLQPSTLNFGKRRLQIDRTTRDTSEVQPSNERILLAQCFQLVPSQFSYIPFASLRDTSEVQPSNERVLKS